MEPTVLLNFLVKIAKKEEKTSNDTLGPLKDTSQEEM